MGRIFLEGEAACRREGRGQGSGGSPWEEGGRLMQADKRRRELRAMGASLIVSNKQDGTVVAVLPLVMVIMITEERLALKKKKERK